MFEAHYLSQYTPQHRYQPDYPPFRAAAGSKLTRRLYSYTHQCPLHAWAARGKRKDERGRPLPYWFLYIEYCDRSGAHRCFCNEHRCTQAADEQLDRLFAEATWLELQGLDPQCTRDWVEQICDRP